MGFWGDVKNTIFGGGATNNINTSMVNYDPVTDRLGKIADGSGSRLAPQAGVVQAGRTQLGAPAQLAMGQIDQSRGGMLGVANNLGAIAGGRQAGAGELAVNRQVGQAIAANTSAARGARGAGAALAFRNAARSNSDLGLAGAGQAAQAQIQDQANANAQLGQLYSGMYGLDTNVAAQNAQFGQQAMLQQGAMDQQMTLANAQAGNATAIANLQAQLAQTGMNDQQQLAALGQILGWDQAKLQAEIAKAQVAAGDKGILPGLLQAGGQAGIMAAASDERLKADVRDGGRETDEMMRALRARSYRYKDPKWGEGRRLGIMAQDLAKSAAGRDALVAVDSAGHLGFDINKATSAALASVARLHERLEKLEGKVG